MVLWNYDAGENLESSLESKEIKPVHPKGNQLWIFTGRTDAEAEAPNLWQPNVKSWLIGEDPDARKDWRQEKKWTTEDEMIGWHHQLNGHGLEKTQGDTKWQGSLEHCSPLGHKESDMMERLNDINRNQPWTHTGKNDAEAEAPILWPPDANSQLIGEDSDAVKDWGQEEKGVTEDEDEMVGWHYWLNEHEFEQIPGDSEGQGSLAHCSPLGHKESDTT